MIFIVCIIVFLSLIIPIFISIFKWCRNRALLRTVTSARRGTRSERNLIIRLLRQGIPSSVIFHDIYLEKYPGHYSQIDAVVISRVGIVVFEVKDYSGYIFGKGNDNYWTQTLAYGKEKYRFYNPFLQNCGHIETLKRRLRDIGDVPFYSVVIFYGKCKLRKVSHTPPDSYIGYAKDVKRIMKKITANNPHVEYHDKGRIINVLREGVANGSDRHIVERHIKNVRNYAQ